MPYTKEQIESRTSDMICIPCGVGFLTDKQRSNSGVHTSKFTECGLCLKKDNTLNIRHFNYLNYPTQEDYNNYIKSLNKYENSRRNIITI